MSEDDLNAEPAPSGDSPPDDPLVSAAEPPPSADPTQPASHYVADVFPAMERPPERLSRLLTEGDSAIGKLCNVCDGAFTAGMLASYVLVGPGADPRQQEYARLSRPYDAIWLLACAACVRGG